MRCVYINKLYIEYMYVIYIHIFIIFFCWYLQVYQMNAFRWVDEAQLPFQVTTEVAPELLDKLGMSQSALLGPIPFNVIQ